MLSKVITANVPRRAFGEKFSKHLTESVTSAQAKAAKMPMTGAQQTEKSAVFFKPLIICGPVAVGKSCLINHLRFSRHHLFEFMKPYTTKQIFDRSEIENVDYIKASPEFF
jgi:hypothetical protein